MTTIEQLKQALAGEIENRFENREHEVRTILGIGDRKIFARCINGGEWAEDIDYVCAHWSHSPTPQPEEPKVIWEHEDGSHFARIRPDGEIDWSASRMGGLSCFLIPLAKSYASLHSSLKALEQEREQIEELREIAKRTCLDSAGLHELGFPNTALLVEKLHALSPYPREEKS